MLEVLKSFEEISLRLAPAVLAASGVVFLIGGLCVWLGGLRWARAAAGILAALFGGLCGFLMAEGEIAAIVITAAVAAGFAMLFEKVALTLVAVVLTGFIALVIFNGPSMANDRRPADGYETAGENQLSTYDIKESLALIKGRVVLLGKGVVDDLDAAAIKSLVIAAVAAIGVATVGILMPRLIMAAGCSEVGTGLIFAGMVLLLLCKGTQPISGICEKAAFYKVVMTAMIVFGIAAQLLLCPIKKPERVNKNSEDCGEEK